MNDPQGMIAAYLEGTLTAEQVAELEQWLRADRARAVALVREAMLDCHLAELLREQNLEHIATEHSDDSQFGTLLAALDAPEGGAELVKLADQVKPDRRARPHQANANPITAHDLATVGGYLLRRALTSKPAILAYAAAIALLAAVLLIPQLYTPAQPTAQQPPAILQPTPSLPPAAPTVATLTATHNAKWAEGAFAPGSKLHANQRLTLTAGFAEITTARGAIAILEGPATIEMTDSDNALHLHTGKLVGICETESSKGFLVRTPHMDVTDLGTMFAISLQFNDIQVHVAQGEVEVQVLTGGGLLEDTHLLKRNRAIAYSHESGAIREFESEPDQFVWGLPSADHMPDYVLAYWRFEDGIPGAAVAHTSEKKDYSNPVIDSSPHGNSMYTFNGYTQPRYSSRVPLPIVPRTGKINRIALDDTVPVAIGTLHKSRNLYTRPIQSKPTISIDDAVLVAWTVEASVMPKSLEGKQCYVGKSLLADESMLMGMEDGRFFVELANGDGRMRRVDSNMPASEGQWYHLAAVCDGTSLKLFARANSEERFSLLGQTEVTQAMPVVNQEWTIGGTYLGYDAIAIIDEVRISRQALPPIDFLFSYPKSEP